MEKFCKISTQPAEHSKQIPARLKKPLQSRKCLKKIQTIFTKNLRKKD